MEFAFRRRTIFRNTFLRRYSRRYRRRVYLRCLSAQENKNELLGRFAEKVVPLMAVIYIAGAVLILIIKYQMIPAAFVMIVKGAFKPMAATGGFAGNICIPRCCNFRFGRRYKKQSLIACKAGGYILRGFVCRFICRL